MNRRVAHYQECTVSLNELLLARVAHQNIYVEIVINNCSVVEVLLQTRVVPKFPCFSADPALAATYAGSER